MILISIFLKKLKVIYFTHSNQSYSGFDFPLLKPEASCSFKLRLERFLS